MWRYASVVEPFLDLPRPVAPERRGRGRPPKYQGRWFGDLLRDIAEIAKANPALSDRGIAARVMRRRGLCGSDRQYRRHVAAAMQFLEKLVAEIADARKNPIPDQKERRKLGLRLLVHQLDRKRFE